MADRPLAYVITFTTYGAWLHGQAPGSIDDKHNEVGTPFAPPNPQGRDAERQQMTQEPYLLDEKRRNVVRDAIIEECTFRKWQLWALHVRVHIVVTADRDPEFVMKSCKARASKCLNNAGLDSNDRKRWTPHGSTRYLWNDEAVVAKIDYTLRGQGDPMATYSAEDQIQ